jgi:hypothetical protein
LALRRQLKHPDPHHKDPDAPAPTAGVGGGREGGGGDQGRGGLDVPGGGEGGRGGEGGAGIEKELKSYKCFLDQLLLVDSLRDTQGMLTVGTPKATDAPCVALARQKLVSFKV